MQLFVQFLKHDQEVYLRAFEIRVFYQILIKCMNLLVC